MNSDDRERRHEAITTRRRRRPEDSPISPPPVAASATSAAAAHTDSAEPGTRRSRRPASDEAAPRPVAVIDCGTSSVRAFLAEVRGAQQRILEDLVYPVDLTPGFTGGTLDRGAMDAVVEAFTGIKAAAAAYGITDIRAVATSALREAANSDVLIERLRYRTGVVLEVIDGSEAARLYVEALRVVLSRSNARLNGNTLMIDIGGGSTSMSLIRQGKLVHSVDEHFGTMRLYEQFKGLKDNHDFAVSVDRFALGAARMMLGRLPENPIKHLVVTGNDVRRLVGLLAATGGAAPDEADQLLATIEPGAVAKWLEKMQGMTPRQRAEACASDEFLAARLLPAASLIKHLCAASGADKVVVPQLTLRDGLLADLLPGAHGPHHLDSSHLLAEARQLVQRYGGNQDYAENTAKLAVRIFDDTIDLHGLGSRERTLLEFSALVHDIGSYINVRERHKHTMYIILAADIAGLTALEQQMVANIARYHRRSQPESHHQEFQALPRRERVVVSYLAAILRLAYGLDVERTQRIRDIRCEVSRQQLLVHVDTRQVALERWSVEGKKGMFAEVFGLDVKLVPREGA